MIEAIITYPNNKSVQLFDTATGTIYTLSWQAVVVSVEVMSIHDRLGGSSFVIQAEQALAFWQRLKNIVPEPPYKQLMQDAYDEAISSLDPKLRGIPEVEAEITQVVHLKHISPGEIVKLTDDTLVLKTALGHDGSILDPDSDQPNLYISLRSGMPVHPDKTPDKAHGFRLSLTLLKEH